MPNPIFDQLLRLRLERLEFLPAPDDWVRMEAALETSAAPVATFDTFIAAKMNAAAVFPLTDEDVSTLDADFERLEAFLPDPFDTLVAAKLHEAAMPGASSHAEWERLEESLPNTFDVQVAAALNDMELAETAQGWERVEAALTPTFDEVVRIKLAEAAYPEAAQWPQMASVMTATAVGDALHNAAVPYNPADWALMEKRLNADGFAIPWYSQRRLYASAAAIALLVTAGAWFFAPQQRTVFLAKANTLIHRFDTNTVHASPSTTVSPDEVLFTLSPKAPVPALAQVQPLSATLERGHQGGGFIPEPIRVAEIEDVPFEPMFKAGPMMGRGVPEPFDSGPATRKARNRQEVLPLTAFGGESRPEMGNSPGRYLGVYMDVDRPRYAPVVSVGAYMASFKSAAELNSPGQRGTANGVRVEVRVADHWSFVTGILAAQKHFVQTYFDFPEETQNWVATQVTGDISLVEVPLMVKFDPSPNKRLHIYAQGGIATGVSTHERYTTQANQQTSSFSAEAAASAPKTEQAGLRTYVGVLQFSPGIELGLCKRLKLQAEPYLQMSIQGMGTRRSKLSSSGIAVSLSYTINPHKAGA